MSDHEVIPLHRKEQQPTKSAKELVLPFLLFFSVGVAPWLVVNGTWLQMFALVRLAEGPSIASYLTLSLQFSNLLAFGYVALQNYKPIKHEYTITSILVLGIAVALLMSFFWDDQTKIGGTEHSVALIVLMFLSGVVGCLSVVVCYPFASLYNVELISAFSAGTGSSGLIASIVTLIEKPSANLRVLSVNWFFRLLAFILCISLVAFILLTSLPQIKRLKQRQQLLHDYAAVHHDHHEADVNHEEPKQPTFREIFHSSKACLITQLVISIMYYSLMGMSPYAVHGFKNSEELLLWFNILSMVCGTLGRLISAYFKFYRIVYTATALFGFWLFVFIMCFVEGKGVPGSVGWIIVAAYAVYSGLYGYTDTIIYMKVGTETEPRLVESASRYTGLSNQLGSFAGSITAFLLVLFHFSK